MSKKKTGVVTKKDQVENVDEFLEDANRFNVEIRTLEKKEVKTAWLITKVAVGALFLSLASNFMLFPLKEVRTEVLVLDKNKGQIEPLQTLKEVQISLDESFHYSFLNTLVTSHERFVAGMAEDDYWTVAAFLSPQLQEAWGKEWDTENPKSPLNVYRGKELKPEILTITLKQSESNGKITGATIRFRKSIRGGGSADSSAIYVATVSYQLVDVATDPKARRINPLGFQVTWYEAQPETPGRVVGR